MKSTNLIHRSARQVLSVVCAASLLVIPSSAPVFGQNPAPPPESQQPAQLLPPEQLDTLVAPIALYPDPLLSQVLAASTYPLEVVEAQQWLQQNGNLRGTDLMNAVKQQNWDPSVQALVAFPNVVSLLNRDVRWTTDLGNAFLAQQKDVMDAVQRMRVRAQQNGKLVSTPQQTVTTETQGGQSAVVIDPPDPQVMYVPDYNPAYVWGPPAWGYYPPLGYPAFGFGFGPGIYLGGFFPAWAGWGWGGWGLGWGWGCGWFGGGIFVNNFFFNHYGFHGLYHGGFGGGRFAGAGREAWAHDPYHRAGVGYANRNVAARFNNSRFTAGRASSGGAFNGARSSGVGGSRGFNNAGSSAARGFTASNRAGVGNSSAGGGWQRFNSGGSTAAHGFAPSNRTATGNTSANRSLSGGGFNRSSNNSGQSYRGSSGSSFGGGTRSYSTPRNSGGSSRSYAAPRSSGGGASMGHSSGGGGHAGGGSGGGHASGGGAHGGGRR
jgi:hypothetical protein